MLYNDKENSCNKCCSCGGTRVIRRKIIVCARTRDRVIKKEMSKFPTIAVAVSVVKMNNKIVKEYKRYF